MHWARKLVDSALSSLWKNIPDKLKLLKGSELEISGKYKITYNLGPANRPQADSTKITIPRHAYIDLKQIRRKISGGLKEKIGQSERNYRVVGTIKNRIVNITIIPVGRNNFSRAIFLLRANIKDCGAIEIKGMRLSHAVKNESEHIVEMWCSWKEHHGCASA